MKKILNLLFCALFLFGTYTVFSQAVYEKGIPYTIENPTKVKSTNEIPVELMPELDYDKLLKEDEKDQQADVAPRFGYLHEVNYNLKNSGTWERLPNGDRIWRLTIFAPKARTININYSKYNVPFGGKLHIYNKDKTDIIGPFTRENEKVNGEFATGFTKGEECTIEYYEPRNAFGKSDIEISGIVHGYKSIRNFVDDFIKNFNSSGPCNNDVECGMSAGWEDQIKSVALHILANGTRWCSGALINNTANDCKPYFLSADHCFDTESVGTVLNDMFVFNYHSPTPACPGTPAGDGSTSESITGATIIAKAVNSDFCLFELSTNPLNFYDVYYSGWDRTNTPSNSVVGIHHPAGDVKKISFENDPVESTNYSSATQGANRTHWHVPDWDAGTTEGGSSGSPLFDQTTKRIIGQLHGGGAACSGSSNNGAADWYGKIWYSWDQNGPANTERLAPWLDPINTGATFTDQTNCTTPMPPTAQFNPSDMSSFSFCNDGDIQMNNTSTGVPTTWSWVFTGAGVSPTTSTNPSPVVTVSSSGTLTAELTVTNTQGSDTRVQTYPITISSCTTNSTCDSPALDIPDNNATGASSNIVIANSAVITDVDINLDITHTYVGDLTVNVSFNGTTVTLVDEPTCNSNNIVGVTFDDDATNGTFSSNGCSGGTNASPAFTGTYNPANLLSAFNGMDQAGTWTITVIDGAGQDIGTLDSWCLTLTTASNSVTCYTDLDNTNGLNATETGISDYESSTYIHTSAPIVIQNGAQVDYDATTDIELNADFEVQLGAIFHAIIDGCNNGSGGSNFSETSENQ